MPSLRRPLLVLALLACLAGCSPKYAGPVSDHFDGEVFSNPGDVPAPGPLGMMEWKLTECPAEWPDWIGTPPGEAPPAKVDDGKLRVTFVNHATVLIQVAGVAILTDPIWSERCSPFSWVGPKRVRRAGIRFQDLPPIDAVLISHDHYDHLDLPTLRRLEAACSPRVFVGLGNGRLLKSNGIEQVTELDWWGEARLSASVNVVFTPAQHFSGRGLTDQGATLWGGFVLETPAGRIYFAGDTGYGPHFQQVGERYGPLRLSILPVGGYAPRWFLSAIHMNPLDALQAHRDLGAEHSMGVHFGTFGGLTDEPIDQPGKDLAQALALEGVDPDRFRLPEFGERWDVPPTGEASGP